MNEQAKLTVDFLRNVLSAATIEGSRWRLDIFTDRLTSAASHAKKLGGQCTDAP